MPDTCLRGSRHVSVLIFERDGLGDPISDPTSRMFQVVEADRFDATVPVVLYGNEVAFCLGFPGGVMRDFPATTSVRIGVGCRARSHGASIYSRSREPLGDHSRTSIMSCGDCWGRYERHPGTDLSACCLMDRFIGIMEWGRENRQQPEKIRFETKIWAYLWKLKQY